MSSAVEASFSGGVEATRSRIRCNPGVFARLRSFGYNILRRNKVSTFSQDRYAAALRGLDALLKWNYS